MRKHSLLFTTLLFLFGVGIHPTLADSDWTISGSNMYSGVSGHVGIQNTAPNAMLSITQNSTHSKEKISLWNTSKAHMIGTEAYHVSIGPGAGYSSSTGVKFYSRDGELAGQIGFGGSGSPSDRQNSYFAGNVGIQSTATPNALLQVTAPSTHDKEKLSLWDNSNGHMIGTESYYTTLGPGSGYTSNSIGTRFYVRDGDLAAEIGVGGGGVSSNRHDSTFYGNVQLDNTLSGPSGNHLELQAQTNSGILFHTNGNNEKMRITKEGNVRIGLSTLPSSGESYEMKNARLYTLESDAIDDESAVKGIAYGKQNANGSTPYNPIGVWGIVDAQGNSNGQPMGIRGDAVDANPADGQYGVLGYNYATSQDSGRFGAGVYGGSVGVPGEEGDYSGKGHGVQGETYSTYDGAAGVWGSARSSSGKVMGVYGETHSNVDGTAGVKGVAQETSGATKGVWGQTNSVNSSAYGVYASGTLGASGAKPAVVYTESQGPTQLYAVESPEIWFEDFGEGKIVNGHAQIEFDPLFLETITISEDHPYHVFIQPYEDSSISMHVKKNATNFEVSAPDAYNRTIHFSYRIVAKRKYYEDYHLNKTNVPIDIHMRPDLNQEGIRELNDRWGLEYPYDE